MGMALLALFSQHVRQLGKTWGLADGLNHSQKDRLVYKFDDTRIYIFAIGGHYDSFEL